MALSELTSNLSWYGANAGFRAQQNVEQTRFNYDPGDLTVAVAPRGFDNAGFQSNAFMARLSGNAFNINGQGTATRLAQQGEGTKFPIGPEGQVHEFDIKRTGFSLVNRYGDTFNNKTLKGLAATYTAASPINDMYNKYKVRDEVHDPYGYAKPPFILKGIQRDGSSDPERYGMPGVTLPSLNVPNGGIVVNGTRTADDIARIGKFLIRPDGLMFIAKQQLLRQMLPNLESKITVPAISGAVNKANPQRLYNPLNTIASILGLPIGARFRNFGLTPNDDGISRYEDVVVKNRETEESKLRNNRLSTLRDERYNSSLVEDLQSPYWKSISTLSGGPDSLGGLGGTLFTKSPTSLTPVTEDRQYSYFKPYLSNRDGLKATGNTSKNDQENIDNRNSGTGEKNSAYTERAFTEINLFNFLNSRPKNSLKQLVIENRKEPVTVGYDFNLTGIKSQIAFHGGQIRGYGAFETTLLKNSYTNPYIGDDRTTNDDDIINANITGQTDELSRINGLYTKVTNGVDDNTFNAIPQREINKANDIQRTTGPVIDTVKYNTLSYGRIRSLAQNRPVGTKLITDATTGKTFDVRNTPISRRKSELTEPGSEQRKTYSKIVNSLYDTTVDILWAGGSNKDLVKLKFGSIQFLAYITSLSMSDSFSTDDHQDAGAAYQAVKYSSHSRNVSIGFMVVADRPDRLEKQWKKLATLQALAGPISQADAQLYPKVTTLTVGDIYKGVQVIIESLSFDIDTETPWEITPGHQRPMYIAVNADCKIMPYNKVSLPTVSYNEK
jgi:hypothetical protein